MKEVDVTLVDGPHSPEQTEAAAQLIPDAVRYLNYASLPADNAPGISYPGDVDSVLDSIQAAAGGLRQTLDQLAQCLQADLDTGRLRLDAGKPWADDPAQAVEVACHGLASARAACAGLQAALTQARQVTSAMYLVEEKGVNGE